MASVCKIHSMSRVQYFTAFFQSTDSYILSVFPYKMMLEPWKGGLISISPTIPGHSQLLIINNLINYESQHYPLPTVIKSFFDHGWELHKSMNINVNMYKVVWHLAKQHAITVISSVNLKRWINHLVVEFCWRLYSVLPS